MRRFIHSSFVVLAVVVFGAASPEALAQEAARVVMRANVQDGFIRLVFTGAGLPKAQVQDNGANGLTVRFDQPVDLENAGAAAGVSPATSVAEGSDGRSVQVTTGPIARHRVLALGTRLFVDIYTKDAPREGAAPAQAAKADKPAASTEAPVPPAPKTVVTQVVETKPAVVADTAGMSPVERAKAQAKALAAGKSVPATAPAKPAAAQSVATPKPAAEAPVKVEDTKPVTAAEPAEDTPATASTAIQTQDRTAEAAAPVVAKAADAAKPALNVAPLPVKTAPISAPDNAANTDIPAEATAALKALDASQKNIIVTPGLPESAEEAPASAPDEVVAETAAQTAPMPAAPVADVTSQGVTPLEVNVAPFKGSAMITVGSTQGLAMALIERGGYAWMVLSEERLSVAPQISGPDAASVGPIEPVEIQGGSAYRIKLPAGAHVRAEGGGLVWRLYIEGAKPTLKSVAASRDFSDTVGGARLHIALANAVSVLRLPDPSTGEDLAVVTVPRSDARFADNSSYVDFDVMPAVVGAVLRPKADGLRIAVEPNDVVVGRAGGLRISADGPRQPPMVRAAPKPQTAQPLSTIFNFRTWEQGGPKAFLSARRAIDEAVATASEDRKLPRILDGAKFMLAQGMPQEANGFIQMAQGYMPALVESGEFQAMSGAVSALMGDTNQALNAFNAPGLQKLDEAQLWRAYAQARAGNLAEAQKSLDGNGVRIVQDYPARLQAMMLPPLIETALAGGRIDEAEMLTGMYDKAAETSLDFDHDQAVAYFRARAAQLRGDNEAAAEFLRDASNGTRGPYPVRATLALVERGTSARTISREDAIRKLERFRYGWRGDELETDVLERLGMLYVTGGEQRRGLTILRDATRLTTDPAEKDKLTKVMQKAFRELYSGQTKEKMSPVEAAGVAAEFADLMPAAGEGEQITMTIADQMVAIDLLDRAADMIDPMVASTTSIANAVRYAERAAAIRILNEQPDLALKVIDQAQARPDAAGAIPPDDVRRLAMLRAKAKAELKRTDDALAELTAISEDAESLRLMADISWSAQRWATAADAFEKLVRAANLSATRAPTLEQAQLVLNEALALNLAGDTERLDKLRTGYGDIMRRSDLNQPFLLVTRTAQTATLADRETLLKLVSEVDLFKDTLERYKSNEIGRKPTSAAPVPAAADQKPAELTKPAETPAKTEG